MTTPTADLMDEHADRARVVDPIFSDFGGHASFDGPVFTLKAHEDNTLVREALEQPGEGQVLVIDGGGSLRCAMVGDNLARLGAENGWAGILVFGCIRDARIMRGIEIGIKALATNPRKSIKRGVGETQIPVSFGGVTFAPGDHLYADEDGVVVASEKLD